MARRTYAVRADVQRLDQEVKKLESVWGQGLEGAPEGQRAHYERLLKQGMKLIEELDEAADFEASRAQRIDSVRTAAQNPLNRMAGAAQEDAHNTSDVVGRNGSNPWANRAGVFGESPSELRSRALDAVALVPNVTDDTRERMTQLLDRTRDPECAEYLLGISDPLYKRAFLGLLSNPQSYMGWDPETREAWNRVSSSRTAMSLTSAAGGYLAPFELDSTIVVSNAGVQNQLRRIARVVPTSQNVAHFVSSAGVTAEITAEAAEAADASPSFSQPQIQNYKMDAYLQASYEVVQDTNIESDIGMLIADAKDRLEAQKFTTGTGSGEPLGVITRLQAVTASRVSSTTNGVYGAPDVYAVDNALSPRWRNNASWVANRSIYNLTRQFATGSGPQSAFWADLGAALQPTLLGYPTYQASDMQATLSAATASNDDILVLGDWQQFVISDRIGMALVVEPLIKGANRRPTGEIGYYCTWRSGSGVLVDDAFRMLRV